MYLDTVMRVKSSQLEKIKDVLAKNSIDFHVFTHRNFKNQKVDSYSSRLNSMKEDFSNEFKKEKVEVSKPKKKVRKKPSNIKKRPARRVIKNPTLLSKMDDFAVLKGYENYTDAVFKIGSVKRFKTMYNQSLTAS